MNGWGVRRERERGGVGTDSTRSSRVSTASQTTRDRRSLVVRMEESEKRINLASVVADSHKGGWSDRSVVEGVRDLPRITSIGLTHHTLDVRALAHLNWGRNETEERVAVWRGRGGGVRRHAIGHAAGFEDGASPSGRAQPGRRGLLQGRGAGCSCDGRGRGGRRGRSGLRVGG